MASSQGTTRSLFCGEVIWSQSKYYVMNLLENFEWEAKKYGYIAMCTWKYPRLLVNNFSSNWNTSIIHLLASQNDHLLTFMPNNVHEKKSLLLWMRCVCVQHLSGFNHQFVDSLTFQNHVFKTASPYEMYVEFLLKLYISQLVAPIEALFVTSSPGFGGLYSDINFLSSDNHTGSYLRNNNHKLNVTVL